MKQKKTVFLVPPAKGMSAAFRQAAVEVAKTINPRPAVRTHVGPILRRRRDIGLVVVVAGAVIDGKYAGIKAVYAKLKEKAVRVMVLDGYDYGIPGQVVLEPGKIVKQIRDAGLMGQAGRSISRRPRRTS